MAKVSTPPIPYKIYRHFAVATVAMTGAIAMFADENTSHDVSQLVQEQETREEAPMARAAIVDSNGLIRNDLAAPISGFGSEASGDYGAPLVTPASGGGSEILHTRRQTEPGGARLAVPGYDQAWIDALSEEQYRIFLDSISPEMLSGATTAEQRAQQQSSIEAASARRAGRAGQSGDAPPE